MPTFLTTRQVAERLQVSIEHVCDLIKHGRLKAYNVGVGTRQCTYRIDEDDFRSFLDEAQTAASRLDKQPVRRRKRRGIDDEPPQTEPTP